MARESVGIERAGLVLIHVLTFRSAGGRNDVVDGQR